MATTPRKERLVIVGNGMAGGRLVEEILQRDPDRFAITVFGAEPYGNYNRILLSNVLNGTQRPEEIFLNPLSWYREHGVALHAGVRVTKVDRTRKVVRGENGIEVPYDRLVLATGSSPFVPPLEGREREGVFVFRTLDDCEAIASYAAQSRRAVVLGGGLLGLEAARGLLTHRLAVTVVELGSHLMAQQLDPEGGKMLQRTIEAMGITVFTETLATAVLGDRRVEAIRFKDGTVYETDMVVISCGIRPNVELAKAAGLPVERAILVDDRLQTEDPDIYAVGECAQHRGTVYGLVAPIWEQCVVLADLLTETRPEARYLGSKLATRLKVLGVNLVSLGSFRDARPDDEMVTYSEPGRGVYKRLLIRNNRLIAGCLLGDETNAEELIRLFSEDGPLPEDRARLLFGLGGSSAPGEVTQIPDDRFICSCNQVTKGRICQAIREGHATVSAIASATKAGTGCGGCRSLVQRLVEAYAGEAALDPSVDWYVPAVPLAKEELVAEITRRGLRSVSAVLQELGNGSEDPESKMGLASLLRSVWNDQYVDERDSRFINDRVHANIQKDGTFSVVPRIYGGVVTPEQLRRIADVAEKYRARMVKITGGQRIDILGVRKEDLPAIWRELGMPSGHAYTKAFRTCKTCVGTEFCRFGVGDAISLGIQVEKRFQGIEFPHKVKLAASGCPRNCAEASTKDIGYIAVEDGWEVLVGGAAGSTVRKGDLLCKVKTHEEAIRITGRFMEYYRRHGKYRERTHAFVERIGIERLRQILVEDSEGICAELDAAIEEAVRAYRDPWLEGQEPVHPRQFAGPELVVLP
ncbi:MAG: nitrite reductase [NAD(P)H] [Candidatus Poribacteria bacterium]|nr:MAG: nitrite reductase [NAD(P)H] [Candidatus Poribacteria bacterium]